MVPKLLPCAFVLTTFLVPRPAFSEPAPGAAEMVEASAKNWYRLTTDKDGIKCPDGSPLFLRAKDVSAHEDSANSNLNIDAYCLHRVRASAGYKAVKNATVGVNYCAAIEPGFLGIRMKKCDSDMYITDLNASDKRAVPVKRRLAEANDFMGIAAISAAESKEREAAAAAAGKSLQAALQPAPKRGKDEKEAKPADAAEQSAADTAAGAPAAPTVDAECAQLIEGPVVPKAMQPPVATVNMVIECVYAKTGEHALMRRYFSTKASAADVTAFRERAVAIVRAAGDDYSAALSALADEFRNKARASLCTASNEKLSGAAVGGGKCDGPSQGMLETAECMKQKLTQDHAAKESAAGAAAGDVDADAAACKEAAVASMVTQGGGQAGNLTTTVPNPDGSGAEPKPSFMQKYGKAMAIGGGAVAGAAAGAGLAMVLGFAAGGPAGLAIAFLLGGGGAYLANKYVPPSASSAPASTTSAKP